MDMRLQLCCRTHPPPFDYASRIVQLTAHTTHVQYYHITRMNLLFAHRVAGNLFMPFTFR